MGKSEHLSIRVTPEEKRALEQRAEREDLSVGQLIRRMVSRLAEPPSQRSVSVRRVAVDAQRTRLPEQEWLGRNMESLTPGHWVVVEGDSLVASGPDYSEVVNRARRQGVLIPFVVRIGMPDDTIFMGL